MASPTTPAPNPTAVPAPSVWSLTVDTGSVFQPAEYFAQADFEVQEQKKKSLLEAYMLALPLGWLGAHHFYLGRPGFGVLYLFTFGLLGAGYVIDLIRLPWLVSHTNKRSRERSRQLKELRQQHMREQRSPGQPAGAVYRVFEPRNLADAYVLWFPCGLFGFHHFYLRNNGMGLLYLFTFGLLGIGWLIDAVRMPSLVKDANEAGSRVVYTDKNQCSAHILALSPLGIVGGHHYYLNRPIWGILYTFTLGLLGFGWVCDWFRVNVLVRRANAVLLGKTQPDKKYLDDAYVLCFPFGFTGLHHFYLNRHCWGVLYFFTFGLLGVGWIVDWFRLPCLVKECNARLEESRKRLLVSNGFGVGQGGYVNQGGFCGDGGVAVVVSQHQPNTPQLQPQSQGGGPAAPAYDCYPPPPPPPPAAGYPGYQSGYPAGMAYAGPYPTYLAAPPGHFAVGSPDLGVCGSDGKTYGNTCEMKVVACM
nr:hypothetical protein BaRGS_005013 [Batillaria attramentaria]